MAKKDRSVYVCASCGHQEAKWLGRCPACGQWNTLEEVTPRTPGAFAAGSRPAGSRPTGHASGGVGPSGSPAAGGVRDAMAHAVPLGDVAGGETLRFPTGIAELDRVLGGGAGLGASALIGGEPGIGKSTLMLQMAARFSDTGPVLYVTGEEAAARLKGRAERLGLRVDGVHVLAGADINSVLGALERLGPAVIVIDSIQTLFSPEAGSAPGSVNQLKYCVFELTDWARGHGAALFLVAHVTKEGAIAGPKVVEHMVDTVLMFEEAEGATRILRATKNRLGATDEIGLFRMGPDGLREVPDP
ncbi:MAG: ATPase domain-containing protein, partial [Spirochaetia bacterium]